MGAFTNVSLEFEFVGDDDEGALVVSSGSLTSVLEQSLAKGDIATACKVFEENEGMGDEVLARAPVASPAVRDNAVKMFERARDFARAARVSEISRRWAEAASFYERAADYVNSARCAEAGEDFLRAAKAYDRAGKVEEALRLYSRAKAREAMADCLARHHRGYEAAQLYRQLGNVRGEVQALRLVRITDVMHVASMKRLASILEHYKKVPDAIQTLVETLRQDLKAASDPEVYGQLIHLFEKAGRPDSADKVRARLARLPGQPSGAFTPPPTLSMIPVVEGNDATGDDGYAFLKALPIFAELELAEMKDLYRLSLQRSVPAGAVLVEAGTEGPGLFVIVSGQVDVLAVSEKGSRPLNSLGPGAWVGEISLLQKAPTSARVVARTPVEVLTISREQFEHFVFEHASAALRIYRLFSANLADRVRTLSAMER